MAEAPNRGFSFRVRIRGKVSSTVILDASSSLPPTPPRGTQTHLSIPPPPRHLHTRSFPEAGGVPEGRFTFLFAERYRVVSTRPALVRFPTNKELAARTNFLFGQLTFLRCKLVVPKVM